MFIIFLITSVHNKLPLQFRVKNSFPNLKRLLADVILLVKISLVVNCEDWNDISYFNHMSKFVIRNRIRSYYCKQER